MVQEPLKKPREMPTIPGYRIEGVVGRGATGVVYRARQNSVDRVVALKVLHQELVGSASALRRMQREARLTAKLAHPNIISAIDMGEIDGQLWYAMELIDGLSLAERIAERPLSEREALRIFIPLCEALRHAHERGVVHRDVKPANILIERGGRALLVDLGLAYSEDDPVLTKSGGTLGTPHYISPEQARDPASADVQSDLWSFGATLYHAVTGRTPFSGESVAEILSNVLYARVPDPREVASELSSGLVLVLRKCLTRDREARYHTPAELLADLERLRERRAPQITGRGLDPLVRRPLRGPRLVAAIGAGVLGLGLVGWLGWRVIAANSRGSGREEQRDPFAALDKACESPDAAGLGAALAEVERLAGTDDLAPRARARLESIRNRLVQRLEGEIGTLERELEAQAERQSSAREFDKALALAQANPRTELARRVGTRSLPEKQSAALDAWRKGLEARVLERRDEAVDAFTTALDHYGDELIFRVDAQEHAGDWKSAQELVSRSTEQLLADSGAESRGLEPRVVELRAAALRKRADERRKSLGESWTRTDEELVAAVETRFHELERALETRRETQASKALQADFAAELARRGIVLERLPVGLVHSAPELAVKRAADLDELEGRYAAQDSEQLFDELERQAEPNWHARRYEEVERLFAGSEGLLRGEASARAGRRAREARLLESVLARAAKKLEGSTGQRMELSTGTVPEVGLLAVPLDPLANGFTLRPDGAVPRALVLRAPRTGEKALATESLAKLAGLAPDALRDPSDRLLRALFLFHEAEPGDVALLDSVRALLDKGTLPDGEPLVGDLGKRVADAHGKSIDFADKEKHERAQGKFNGLRFMDEHNGDARVAKAQAEELLKEEFWTENEKQELRSIRDRQAQRLQASPLDELRATFAPDAIEDAGPGRVRLFFELGKQHGGALEQGSWILNVSGWSPAFAARSDEELLAREGPSLVLEKLRTEKELEIVLQLEEPLDQRPNVLLVSAAGFHVGFLGAPDGGKARWLAGNRSAAEVLEALRKGQGREFPGWKAGSKPALTLTLRREQGRVALKLDGTALDRMELPAPHLEGPATLSVRAWECLRLVSLTLVAARQ